VLMIRKKYARVCFRGRKKTTRVPLHDRICAKRKEKRNTTVEEATSSGRKGEDVQSCYRTMRRLLGRGEGGAAPSVEGKKKYTTLLGQGEKKKGSAVPSKLLRKKGLSPRGEKSGAPSAIRGGGEGKGAKGLPFCKPPREEREGPRA